VRIVQNGLTAQELRYVDLLLNNTWDLPLEVLSDGELKGHLRVPTPAAYILHKGLVHKRRTDAPKREKDLYSIFSVLDGFRGWRERIAADMHTLAATSPTWFRHGLRDLAAAFEMPNSPGVDALVHQRPGTAYPGMTDEQFRQYAWSVLQDLLESMNQGEGLPRE
jgi:hypothetical protein